MKHNGFFASLRITILLLLLGQSAWAEKMSTTVFDVSLQGKTTSDWYYFRFQSEFQTHSAHWLHTYANFESSTSFPLGKEDNNPIVNMSLQGRLNFASGDSYSDVIVGEGGLTLHFASSKYIVGATVTTTNGTIVKSVKDNRTFELSITLPANTVFGNVKLELTVADFARLSSFKNLGENRYGISSKEDLAMLAGIVNVQKDSCQGITFIQTKDIQCDDTYSPIGYYNGDDRNYFRGNYDGQGYRISGITVNRPSKEDHVGLFGGLIEGTLENIILSSSTFSGDETVGSIVGACNGTVRNCHVEESVTLRSSASKALTFGGIAGTVYASGRVAGCVSAAAVIASDGHQSCEYFGGIAGVMTGTQPTVTDCLYTGTQVIAPKNTGSVIGSFNSKSSRCINNYYIYAEGLPGGVNGNDVADASRARTLTLGPNVVLEGEHTPYNRSGLTAIGSDVLYYNNTYYSGEGKTLTLGYSGDVPAGHEVVFIASAGTISGNTLSMPAENVTITAILTPVLTGYPSGGFYWSTYFNQSLRHTLPEGATAYTMDSNKHLYRLGDDGRTIPANKAVVIISDKQTIKLIPSTDNSTITDHAPGGNILHGFVPSIAFAGTPYVLGVVNGKLGFYRYTGTTLPANKAFYVQINN